MPRSCTICQHPQRETIGAALELGRSYRDIAGQFGVSKSALERHHAGHGRTPVQHGAAPLSAPVVEQPISEPPAIPALTPERQRRAYRCDRYPFLSIGGKASFERGRLETDDPKIQHYVEASAMWKTTIFPAEPAADQNRSAAGPNPRQTRTAPPLR